ncbi:MAG: 2-amino-4-hydroxy-6-hydroxymethyldihydropteridine pyrophosphokinase [Clostridiaceae bacterium BRH_c20a]|nr:MAG: 2-amino-4-hydroxy-6-hydroxymethyldihydropteridine pyrophosphokinase [Clostridiaceae bacterium BRH_c20a]
MAKAYLGLGSNLGDKKTNVTTALEMLYKNPLIEVLKISSFYETEPIGFKEQDWFLNVVVKVETLVEPYKLLSFCQAIEDHLQRKRLIRWGPRTMDVDVLLYENFSSEDPILTIPHPRMTERAFVLVPLEEIEPDLEIKGQRIGEFLNKLEDAHIKRVD